MHCGATLIVDLFVIVFSIKMLFIASVKTYTKRMFVASIHIYQLPWSSIQGIKVIDIIGRGKNVMAQFVDLQQ